MVSRLFCGCDRSREAAANVCAAAYDRWLDGDHRPCGVRTPPDTAPGSPERPIEMCGCPDPLIGAGYVCQRCARPNLAAITERVPTTWIETMPPEVQGEARLI